MIRVDEKLNAVYTSSMATVHGKTAGGIIMTKRETLSSGGWKIMGAGIGSRRMGS